VISVVIPSIPTRGHLLDRALASVRAQTLLPEDVIVTFDDDRQGAAATRQRGLERVVTPWVAFLDDDDEFLPGHLAALHAAASDGGADVLYPWFEVVGGTDPLRLNGRTPLGQPFDGAALAEHNYIPITVLARAEAVRTAGGFSGLDTQEDHGLWLRLLAAGARFQHVPAVTWRWHHHAANTSGLPTRW